MFLNRALPRKRGRVFRPYAFTAKLFGESLKTCLTGFAPMWVAPYAHAHCQQAGNFGATPPSVSVFSTSMQGIILLTFCKQFCAVHRRRFQEHSFAIRHNQTSCLPRSELLSCSRRQECGCRFGRGSSGRG